MTRSDGDEPRTTAVASTDGIEVESSNREQAIHHFRAALKADERGEKQFHVRQSLQLLTIGER